jgi:uncharacterized membrane protein YeaQ/YmgE (transglycosylase-associated protein family)
MLNVLHYAPREATVVGRLIWWMLVGLIAGWLAGKVTKSGGYGIAVIIVVGIVGAVSGALVFRRVANFPLCGLVGAIVGSVALIWLARVLKRA